MPQRSRLSFVIRTKTLPRATAKTSSEDKLTFRSADKAPLRRGFFVADPPDIPPHRGMECKKFPMQHPFDPVREQKKNIGESVERMVLSEPQCDVGCSTCLMWCAVLPARLHWWEMEIERLCRERSMRPNCPSLRRQLDTALAGHASMMRRHSESARPSPPPESQRPHSEPFPVALHH